MNTRLTSRLRNLVGGVRSSQMAALKVPPRQRRLARTHRGSPWWKVQELDGGTCSLVDRSYEPETCTGMADWGLRRCRRGTSCTCSCPWRGRHGWPRRRPVAALFRPGDEGLPWGRDVCVSRRVRGFANGAFRTRQYFLTGYGAERPLLAAVAEAWPTLICSVSFNGRPLTRHCLNSVSLPPIIEPFATLPHPTCCTRRAASGMAMRAAHAVLEGALAGVGG